MTRKFYSSHFHALLTGCYLHRKTQREMRRSLIISKKIDVKSFVANHSTHSVLETIGDGFSWIQDFIHSASCYNGYGAKLSQLLLILSGDVELNPGPFNGDEDISEYQSS